MLDNPFKNAAVIGSIVENYMINKLHVTLTLTPFGNNAPMILGTNAPMILGTNAPIILGTNALMMLGTNTP